MKFKITVRIVWKLEVWWFSNCFSLYVSKQIRKRKYEEDKVGCIFPYIFRCSNYEMSCVYNGIVRKNLLNLDSDLKILTRSLHICVSMWLTLSATLYYVFLRAKWWHWGNFEMNTTQEKSNLHTSMYAGT